MNRRATPVVQQQSKSKGEDEDVLKLIVQLNELALHCKHKYLARLALEHAAHYLSCWMGNVKDFVDKDTILTQLFDMIKPSKRVGSSNDDNKEKENQEEEEEDGSRNVKEAKEEVVVDDAEEEEDKKDNKEEEEVTEEDGEEDKEKGDGQAQGKEEEEQSLSSLNFRRSNDHDLFMGLLHPPFMISMMSPSAMEINKEEDNDESIAKRNNKLWMVNVLGCVIVHNLGVACWTSQLQNQEQREEDNVSHKDVQQVMELFQTSYYMSQQVVNHSRKDDNDNVEISSWANTMAHQVIASSNLIMEQTTTTNHPPNSINKKRQSPNESTTKPTKQQRTMTSSAA